MALSKAERQRRTARGGPSTIIDASEVFESLAALARDTPIMGREALRETAKIVRREARELVPVDTGKLRNGIRFRVPDNETAVITASSEVGGKHREYAAQVHEDLETPHVNGGQAKYLEVPVLEIGSSGEMQRQIAHAIQKRFAGQMGITPPPDIEE